MSKNGPSDPLLPAESANYSATLAGSSSRRAQSEPPTSDLSHATYGIRGKRSQFFAPAYLVFVVKKLRALNFGAGTVNVCLTIVLHVLAHGLPSDVRREVLDDAFELRLNDTQSIMMDDAGAQVKKDEARGTLVFTKREEVEVAFRPTLHGFPFDFQNIHMKFEITSRTYKSGTVRYNLHLARNLHDMVVFKISEVTYDLVLGDQAVDMNLKALVRTHMERNREHMDDPDGLPEMNIAYARLEACRPSTPPEIKEGGEAQEPGQEAGQIAYFPAVWVTIPIYREPNYILLSSVFPLLVLNLFSLCIFLVDPQAYTDRLSIVITILLALFAFLPTYRAKAPLADTTSLDLCVFGSIVIMVLVMLDSQIAGLGHLSDAQRSGVRWLFAGISITIVVAGCLFFSGRYYQYRKTKKLTRDVVQQMTRKRSSLGRFPQEGWRLSGISMDQIASQVVWLKRGDSIIQDDNHLEK